MSWSSAPGSAGISHISALRSAGRSISRRDSSQATPNFPDPPPDFHAVFEAFLSGRWYLFDPTELAPRNQVTRIGTGRDATDVAFATIFGTAQMTQMSPKVKVLEQSVEDAAVAIATS